MAGPEPPEAYTPTVLDYLNKDCWRVVLKYVPIRDIICTERASRRWQKAMLAYLREVRIGIESLGFRFSKELFNFRSIRQWEIPEHSFEKWTYKLGASVVAIYCVSQEMLQTINKNCPHIEVLIIYDPEEKLLLRNQIKNLDHLRKLSFQKCYSISDQCISKFIGSKALEELRVVHNEQVTGQCLTNIEPRKLKSLTLDSCRSLQYHHLEIACHSFNELTRLELNDLPIQLYKHIPLLLENLLKLEVLSIIEFEFDFLENDKKYYSSICKLSSLKNLRLHSQNITNEDLETVTRCCKELRSLDVKVYSFSDLDARCLTTICLNAGARLTTLGFTNCNNLTDEDLIHCIRTCPNLTLLDVSACCLLTPNLLGQAAAARREMRLHNPLRLFVDDTSMNDHYGMDFKELVVDRCICSHKIWS
ncbi:uncharacterized protein LOC134746364 [Cydia strobilella]|uniref:uncharacterized protein LOC134746364 n=1 Tax=Cydia strobilella TaxID=1100964 RepID=UPI0030072988